MSDSIPVIQWATGSMGRSCLRAVLDDPRFRLTGLFVYGLAKEGKDAGAIARRPDTGVLATRSIDAILALDAAVVVHCPRLGVAPFAHDDDVRRLLESGKDVVSINDYFEPAAMDAARADALHRSAIAGGATLAGTGVNPGWAAERMAAQAAALCLSHRSITTRETVVCASIPSAAYAFDTLGFGVDPAALDLVDGQLARLFTALYAQSVAGLAWRIGLRLDSYAGDHAVVPATRDLDVAAGTIAAGTVAATTWRVHGIADGVRRITHEVNWVMDPADPAFAGRPSWEIVIDGTPGLEVAMRLVDTAPAGVRTKSEQLAVAAMIGAAIPRVRAAPPGTLPL